MHFVTATVYGLYDPDSPEEIRYIGKTVQPFSRRWQTHQQTSKSGQTYKDCWWRSISPRTPAFVFLSQKILRSEDADTWANSEEIRLIHGYRLAGHRLTNLTTGGEGVSGWAMPEEVKEKIRQALSGKQKSEEHRSQMSRNLASRWEDPDFRQFMQEVHCDKEVSDVTRSRMSQAHVGKTHTSATRKKMSERCVGSGNPFFGKRHTEESKEKIRQGSRRRKLEEKR